MVSFWPKIKLTRAIGPARVCAAWGAKPNRASKEPKVTCGASRHVHRRKGHPAKSKARRHVAFRGFCPYSLPPSLEEERSGLRWPRAMGIGALQPAAAMAPAATASNAAPRIHHRPWTRAAAPRTLVCNAGSGSSNTGAPPQPRTTRGRFAATTAAGAAPDAVTYSSSIDTDMPLYEPPGVSQHRHRHRHDLGGLGMGTRG